MRMLKGMAVGVLLLIAGCGGGSIMLAPNGARASYSTTTDYRFNAVAGKRYWVCTDTTMTFNMCRVSPRAIFYNGQTINPGGAVEINRTSAAATGRIWIKDSQCP